jgi:hypothetical protein
MLMVSNPLYYSKQYTQRQSRPPPELIATAATSTPLNPIAWIFPLCSQRLCTRNSRIYRNNLSQFIEYCAGNHIFGLKNKRKYDRVRRLTAARDAYLKAAQSS